MELYKELDPILHSQLRLAIVSILVSVKEAEFGFLKKTTGATAGNLSLQITKLVESNYITVKKSFRGNYPLTTCKITPVGIKAFREYVGNIKQYIKPL